MIVTAGKSGNQKFPMLVHQQKIADIMRIIDVAQMTY